MRSIKVLHLTWKRNFKIHPSNKKKTILNVTCSVRNLLFFVCQMGNPTLCQDLGRRIQQLFHRMTINTNLTWQWQPDKKREPNPPVPLLFSFNSINCPQVKISCSYQFNSISNDAATRSLFYHHHPPHLSSSSSSVSSIPSLFHFSFREQDWVVM